MIDITMPALSPTMETGTLAKWLVKVGDVVKSGDILCEIETDKATMEVESIDEGTVAELLVAEGADAIPVGQVIARLSAEGEEAAPAKAAPTLKANSPPPSSGEGDRAVSGVGEGALQAPKPALAPAPTDTKATPEPAAPSTIAKSDGPPPPKSGEDQGAPPAKTDGTRVNASPLARRLASAQGIDLSTVTGSGPHGRIVKADLDGATAKPATQPSAAPTAAPAAEAKPAAAPVPASIAPAAAPSYPPPAGVPAEAIKLSNMRKTIARRLAESKQTVPHFYLTVDVRLDALLKLRGDLNKSLEASGVKLSVNDLLIKALGLALVAVPDSNVQFAGDTLYKFGRADVSVAVAIPGGLITPIIADAANKRLSVIATEMKDLAARAKDGKLKPEEYTGGTASISNLGMFGIKQFDAVINPPQGLILAVGAGEKRPYVVDDALAIATVMSATGSFDHRAIDGAVGAQFMSAFKALVESPMSMLA
ncbi:pyruvate dehydrogenase complex dihydrolipoamide acetyltransferase [Glacieibacterium megasporae]|uniref:pyruvate dehydrogenase complex dihydrolipoamide acetyltransferase n=1 Tax=Glacieibacterium megasporae TaxID=2835787 RepID=UPI001C1E57AB|nr:pyruvate dehydrogenase complex dihydrolipoamide acetyltransferase [Polymorphobacter megasporae]UAJ09410.1 pyruvate dehydrogenase complex dihydrolipoamide acetyltransferase [Polymorphobacter megasporae]